MKNVTEIYANEYKEHIEDDYLCIGNYEPMVKELGNILIQVDDSDYQGDSRYIITKDNKFGFLVIGWGSCSGCDALQSCSTFDEIQELFEHIQKDVKWFDSKEELKKYFTEKDWELDFCSHEDERNQFIKQVSEMQ